MSLLISLLIFAVVIVAVLYIIDLLPLPGNLNVIAKIVVGVIGLIYLLQTLTGFIR